MFITIRRYIMITNISMIRGNIFSLYKKMYNDNIYLLLYNDNTHFFDT